MKLDEILNSQKAPAPVASTVIPVTKKSGTLRLSDILSQEPSAPSPVQEIAPAQIPQAVAPVKPTFKTYKDLTLKQKAKAGLDRLGLNVGASIGGVIASTVEAFSTGKDVIKGAVTGSTISEELAKDSAYDKVVKDIAKNIQTYTQDSMKNTLTQKKIELGLDPNDTFTDQALSGLGSFMGFVGPGMASKALVTTLGFVKYAPAVTSSLNIANESIVESQDVYKEEKEKGKSDQEAYESFRNTLAGNALLIGVSNKLGGMFDNTTFTGLKRALKSGFAGFMEGSQEAVQQIISNVNTGKPWSLGVKDSFIIGAILGAPANLALDTGDKTKKEAVKEEIAQMDIADDKKQLAIDVIDGVATEEQKAKVVTELIANTESNVPVDETNKTNLQEDIKSMVEQGANVGDIVLALQEEGISQQDAENIVAEVIATPEVEAGTQEYEDLKSDIKFAIDEGANIGEIILKLREAYTVSQEYAENIVAEVVSTPEATAVVKPKATPKKVVTTSDLKIGTEFENVGTLKSITQPKLKGKKKGSVKYYFKHADGVEKYYTEKQALELVRKGYKPAKPRVERAVPQVVDKAKQYGFDNVQYYFDNTDAPETVNYYDNNEKDYVGYRTSTAMADFPEHLRDRKLLNEVEESWYKQTRPEDTGTQASKNRQELYDYLTKQVDNFAKDYNKKVDEQMAQDAKGDGAEFKTREATGTREMAVLDDFKKRYKVQFPTLIVDKIIQGKKTKLHPKGDGTAEGATDGNTIALAFDAIINTGKHELIHLTLNNLDQIPELAKFSRQDILKAQAKKMGIELTKQNEKTVEEQLALDFEAYQNKTYKPNNSTIAKFFASIRDMINNFRGVIVKSNGDVITEYYDAVLYGETARKQEVAITTESNVARYLIDNVLDYRPMYQTRRVLSLSNGIKSIDFKSSEEKQPEFKEALDKSLEVYKESGDLTTKILKDLEGKTTVSKQYILDATNRGDVKQIEKNIIRDMLFFEGDKVNVKDFAFKVQQELLPLFVKSSDNIIPNEDQDYNPFTMNNEGSFTPKYEFVSLPADLRGDVQGYAENIYESPVPTSAGGVHFNYLTKNYFGHTRAEDVPNNVRRVIEVQSDLYQKGNLEKETPAKLRNLLEVNNKEINSKARIDEYGFEVGNTPSKERIAELKAHNKEIEEQLKDAGKLEQYNDPTAHFRMIREEIRTATQDGKSVLQFPTGDTAMKIEGLGTTNHFYEPGNSTPLKAENLSVGKEVSNGPNEKWIITDVLGDGKFKAVQKSSYYTEVAEPNQKQGELKTYFVARPDNELTPFKETFDISGKVDTNNPIYKFYEKEVGRYLKNNYKAETVTDDKGVTWYEVKLKDEYKGAVVAFKERVSRAENEEYIKKTYPKYYAMTRKLLEEAKTKPVSPQAKQGIRSVAKRVEERAKTLGVTVDESYEIKRFVTEVATSEVILENNKDKIEDILNGSFPYPTDVSKTAFLHTIIEDAKARNDTRTLTKAYNRLAEEATVAGQDIAFINSVYKMYDETSPETYLNKIKAERETMDMQKTWSIKNPFAGKDVREKIVRKRTERQKAIRLGVKERTTIKIQELESILDSFVC